VTILAVSAKRAGVLSAVAAAMILACSAGTVKPAHAAALKPAELGHFPVGSKWSWLRNGEPLTITLVSKKGGIGAYESSNGCKYWQSDNFLIPETEVNNCYGYSGTTETKPSKPDIWPLAVGKTQTWTTTNHNSKNGQTSTSRQTCTVDSTEKVKVSAGAIPIRSCAWTKPISSSSTTRPTCRRSSCRRQPARARDCGASGELVSAPKK
jgi:hypothetical protein